MASNASEADAPPPAARPRIGVTTYLEQARWGSWDQPAVLLPHLYVTAVHAAGGVPVLLPPLPDGAREALAGVDGLLVAGGADVDAELYGERPREGNDEPRRSRDAWELALVRAALTQAVPVLGVCRGAQVVNVALGGTLHQHLPDVVGHEAHRPAPARHGRMRIRTVPGSLLESVVGSEVDVPCYHHQSVDRLGEGLVATARADDGTVEAIEVEGQEFALGVQWHPELDVHDLRLFAALVAAARRRARRTGDGLRRPRTSTSKEPR